MKAHQSLQLEHEILSENYDRLRHKSEEIIQTLQQERDGKILECEQLRTQVGSSLVPSRPSFFFAFLL